MTAPEGGGWTSGSMPDAVEHPTWCDASRCTVRAADSGVHQSTPIVIDGTQAGRYELFLERVADGKFILMIVEQYQMDADEPEEMIAFRLGAAAELFDRIGELLLLAGAR